MTTLSWGGGKKNPKYTKVRMPARGAAQVKYKEASARQSRRRSGARRRREGEEEAEAV